MSVTVPISRPVPGAGSRTSTVTDHLLNRLADLGVDRIFGVPGDFTLGLLDHIDEHPCIEWVGTANELGAGYAADGYARVRGFGVVCTTFGVGELSAINAVAGSFAEHVPVLHLVGAPSTATQAASRATHHSLGDGDFGHTLRMSAEVTTAQAMLSTDDPCGHIDRVLAAIVATGRPGYLSLPTDIGELEVAPFERPLTLAASTSDPASLAAFTHAARRQLARGRRPVVLADILVSRMRADRALHRMIDAGGLAYASLLWGRRVVDEHGDGYLGTYVGAASEPSVRVAIETADCVITAGVLFTDLISGFFSEHLDCARRIDVLPHAASVGAEEFADVEMVDALGALAELVAASCRNVVRDGESGRPTVRHPDAEAAPAADGGPLTQEALWASIAAALQPGDLLLADQGTSFYGMGRQRLPHDALFIGQPLWASIGYTLPALLGAALADRSRRPVLLIGDGAAQLTIQELGTILRHDVPAVIVVVNNDGYTVERAIHGPTKSYNDIAAWRWTQLAEAFGARPAASRSMRVESTEALRAALADAAANPGRLTLIEAVTGPLDVPSLLVAVAQAAARANAPQRTR